ncbi:uncharacterized protein C1orf50 homolog [Copidosoma floridanum]|uniref:uncharacterized protein C1orf50 homolog n=1 Tax=Copidosoma floridanum TaxID=29053 RepID=UPI0006C985AF|nr:uncharacterized protein C1orf50 homolog [Copidosoma floridanum]
MVLQNLKRPRNTSIMDSYSDCTPNKVSLVERNIAPQGIDLVNPKAVAKKTPSDLVQLAVEIQKADDYVKANACSKLQIIAEQMRFLQRQAEKVLLEAKENSVMHHAACNFVKHPGNVYHLYQRESGQTYFSMLSPQEWGKSAPQQTYKGSFRLEFDHSWTPLSNTHIKDQELAVLNRIYQNNDTSKNVSLTEYMSIDSS